jgi:BMFP domain-containing protein YqiC
MEETKITELEKRIESLEWQVSKAIRDVMATIVEVEKLRSRIERLEAREI